MTVIDGKKLHAFNPEAHAKMNEVGQKIALALRGTNQGFLLITFGFGEGGRMEYMSNGRRDDVIKMMKEFLQKIEADAPGTN